MSALKTRAAREKISVNALVLKLIDHELGSKAGKPVNSRHDDLDALAGSWSRQDAADFAEATAPFSRIDQDLWE